MIDIINVGSGPVADIGLYDTQTTRATNILSTQIGNLEYAQTLGIDLKYFLSEDFRFQNESFQAYLVQILANYSINVASLVESVNDLASRYVFNLTPAESSDSLVSR